MVLGDGAKLVKLPIRTMTIRVIVGMRVPVAHSREMLSA